MKITLDPTHEQDIYDLEIKRIHIAFKGLGVSGIPREYIKIPTTNMDLQGITHFNTSLENTWRMRNRNAENLKLLQKALINAKK